MTTARWSTRLPPQLTGRAHAAMDLDKPGRGNVVRIGIPKALGLAAGCMAISGCISVDAPTEPIVIELNINIRQEVIYRLAADAGNTIEENADIF